MAKAFMQMLSGRRIALQSKSARAGAEIREIRADEGYDGLSVVALEAISLQNKSVKPTSVDTVIRADEGYDGLLEVTVEGAGDADLRLQSKTVTAGPADTEVTSDEGYDALSSVTVKGDASLKAENIKKDVTLFGVTGTWEGVSRPYAEGVEF